MDSDVLELPVLNSCQPQPDWVELEIVEEIQRQQSLFPDPWEEDEAEPS